MTKMSELAKFLKGCADEFLPSKNYKFKGNLWLDDSHAHYPPIQNHKDLENLVENMTSKLGRTAITDWGESVNRVLKYRKFVDMLKEYSFFNKNLAVDDKGIVSIIGYKGKITEIYSSQEIRTNSHLHITAEGCPNLVEEGLDPRKTVEIIQGMGGIALIEHPATKCHPIKQYTRTTEEDDRLTLEVMEMADAAETFNSCNTLWMYKSNEKAKELANGKIPCISGSDSHFGLYDSFTKFLFLKNMGKSGIYLPAKDNELLTGREIIEQKRQDLKNGDYENLENYTGPITFFMAMIPPIAARKLGIRKDSIS